MPFRETFTRWFGSIRFSIDVSVMCRVPISFLLAMARHMYQQYLAITLELEEEPLAVHVDGVGQRRSSDMMLEDTERKEKE